MIEKFGCETCNQIKNCMLLSSSITRLIVAAIEGRKERKGKRGKEREERKERIGKERKGKERKGKERKRGGALTQIYKRCNHPTHSCTNLVLQERRRCWYTLACRPHRIRTWTFFRPFASP